MSAKTNNGFLSGEPVLGQACPRCRRIATVVYNGNYWCSVCPWVMSEGGRPRRIIAAFLIQERQRYQERGDADGVARMEFYLRNYDGVTL